MTVEFVAKVPKEDYQRPGTYTVELYKQIRPLDLAQLSEGESVATLQCYRGFGCYWIMWDSTLSLGEFSESFRRIEGYYETTYSGRAMRLWNSKGTTDFSTTLYKLDEDGEYDKGISSALDDIYDLVYLYEGDSRWTYDSKLGVITYFESDGIAAIVSSLTQLEGLAAFIQHSSVEAKIIHAEEIERFLKVGLHLDRLPIGQS